jgi:tetratricopeptide (TPR) repeat protein
MRSRALAVLLVSVLTGSEAQAASPGQDALDRGSRLYKEGRYREAVDAFKEATRRDPGLLKAWENLGWAYHRSGRHAEAIETWRTVLKVEPRRTDLLNEIGAVHLGEGRWNEAAQTLARSLEIDAGQPKVRLRIADAFEKAGRHQEAEAHYREVLRLQPTDFDALFRLQEFLERAEREDAAISLLREALPRVHPYRHILELRMARLLARRGDRAYRSGDYEGALAAYDEAVRADPQSAQYRINQGWAHRQLGAPSEAAAAWETALDLDPGKTALYRYVADAAFEQEDLRTAAAMYGRAWAKAERQPSVPFRLAQIALEEGRIDDAMHWLQELFTLADGDAEWSRRVAGLFARAEQPAKGIDFFRRRLAASREPAETRRALSRLHAFQGSVAFQAQQIETAMRELEEAVALDPQSPQALRDLGWVYWYTEHWDSCAKVWGRHVAAHPEDPQAHNLLTHFHLKRKEYAAAVASARNSLRLDPAQPAQQLKLARALFSNGEYTEARRLAEALARDNPEDLPSQVFWGDLLMQYHDFARGKAQWRRVIDLGQPTTRAQYYWVKSMYELGEYDAAVAEATRILDPASPNQMLLQFLADDALVRGDVTEAIRCLRLLVESFPERLPAWLELARLEQEAGQIEAARSWLEQASQHHPDHLDVTLAQAELERRAGRASEAHAAFVALSTAHPSHRDAFWGRIGTALESGRPEEALALLRAGEEALLKPYESRMLEARILLAMGREADAQRALQRVISPARENVYVPILLYHGLGDHPRSASVPVALFEAQMLALHEQGFTTVTVGGLRRMLDGTQPFPKRPILVTFDDARIDSFVRADPVLARYGMKATMFVPTARILDDHPFFADWKRIRSFVEGGRFELQSHGHHAHDPIVVDARQVQGSFLVNREWLLDLNRVESYEEYRARLDADYARSVEEVNARFPDAQVIGYAFPFSEAGQENVGNEPRAAQTNQELLASRFRFGFVQDQSGYNELAPGASATLLLRRYSVPRDMDGGALLRHLAREEPRNAARVQSARMFYWAGEYDRSRVAWERLAEEEPGLQGEAAYFLAAIQYQRGRYDEARRHLRTAEELRFQQLDRDSGLAKGIRWQGGSRLAPRSDFFRDSDGRETQWSGVEVQAGPLGPLDPSFAIGMLSLRQEGHASLTGRELSASARLGPFANWTLEGRAWQRALDGAETTLSFGAGFAFESDGFKLRLKGGREDVSTLLARAVGLQADAYAAQATLRFSHLVLASVDAGYQRLEDENRRRDVAGKLLLRPRWAHGVGFGAAAGWSDTLFQSTLYYSPAQLRFARGVLSYQRRWPGGWLLESEVGLGLATDRLHGDRRILHASGRAGQAWGERVRTLVEGRYGNSPGYSSWSVGGSLQIRVR